MRAISRLLFISAALASCGLPLTKAATDEEHVLKDISKFPYMVMIKTNNTANCSGAIINSNHILTAAHCVNVSGEADLKKLEVLVGGLNSTANTTRAFKVDKLFVHANYSKTFDNDIAILKVQGNLTFVNGTKSIALWNNTAEYTTDCTLAGWDRWKNLNTTYNETLFSARETILNEDICRREYVNIYSPNKYCAQEDFAICSRGGPLVCKNVVWGIASQPNPCMHGVNITLFTKLSTYTSWINATLTKSGTSASLPSAYLMAISFIAYYVYTN